MKHILILALLGGFGGLAAGESKPDWPVEKLTFTIKDKRGWTPASVTVPRGAEVQLILDNKSNAPACFEIADTRPGRFVKKPICVTTGGRRTTTFFANVAAGSYPIRNRYEQQAAGTFTVR